MKMKRQGNTRTLLLWGMVLFLFTAFSLSGCAGMSKGVEDNPLPSYLTSQKKDSLYATVEDDTNKKSDDEDEDPFAVFTEQESLGDRYAHQGNFEMAYMQYLKAQKMAPNRAVLLYKLGIVLQAKGIHEKALTHFSEAIRKEPRLTAAHEAMGKSLLILRRYDQAEEAFRTVLRQQPQNWKAYTYLGILYDHQNRPQEAIEAYQAAIDIQPYEGSIHNNMGIAYMLLGDAEKASASFAQSLRLGYTNTKLYNNMGFALSQMERYDEALAAFMKGGDAAKAHNNLGCLLLRKGKQQEAIEEFQKAIELHPSFYAAANDNLEEAKRMVPGGQDFYEKSMPVSKILTSDSIELPKTKSSSPAVAARSAAPAPSATFKPVERPATASSELPEELKADAATPKKSVPGDRRDAATEPPTRSVPASHRESSNGSIKINRMVKIHPNRTMAVASNTISQTDAGAPVTSGTMAESFEIASAVETIDAAADVEPAQGPISANDEISSSRPEPLPEFSVRNTAQKGDEALNEQQLAGKAGEAEDVPATAAPRETPIPSPKMTGTPVKTPEPDAETTVSPKPSYPPESVLPMERVETGSANPPTEPDSADHAGEGPGLESTELAEAGATNDAAAPTESEVPIEVGADTATTDDAGTASGNAGVDETTEVAEVQPENTAIEMGDELAHPSQRIAAINERTVSTGQDDSGEDVQPDAIGKSAMHPASADASVELTANSDQMEEAAPEVGNVAAETTTSGTETAATEENAESLPIMIASLAGGIPEEPAEAAPAVKEQEPAKPAAGSDLYTVAVSSWKTQAKADEVAWHFSIAGNEAHVKRISDAAGYRVSIGKLASEAEAESLRSKLLENFGEAVKGATVTRF